MKQSPLIIDWKRLGAMVREGGGRVERGRWRNIDVIEGLGRIYSCWGAAAELQRSIH